MVRAPTTQADRERGSSAPIQSKTDRRTANHPFRCMVVNQTPMWTERHSQTAIHPINQTPRQKDRQKDRQGSGYVVNLLVGPIIRQAGSCLASHLDTQQGVWGPTRRQTLSGTPTLPLASNPDFHYSDIQAEQSCCWTREGCWEIGQVVLSSPISQNMSLKTLTQPCRQSVKAS